MSVPPVITARPGKTCGEGRENVEEGPGEDNIVIGPDVHGQHEHPVANTWKDRFQF